MVKASGDTDASSSQSDEPTASAASGQGDRDGATKDFLIKVTRIQAAYRGHCSRYQYGGRTGTCYLKRFVEESVASVLRKAKPRSKKLARHYLREAAMDGSMDDMPRLQLAILRFISDEPYKHPWMQPSS